MENDIEKLKQDLNNKIGKKRFLHSIGVMNMCEKLATYYQIDVNRAKLIGLMHDIAKEMSQKEKIEYVNKNNILCTDIELKLVDILHGKIAGDICKKKYNFDDEMCEAIAIHTTGKENMTILQKILFVADKIDETRNYEGVEELRKLAFKNLDKVILKNIDSTIKINIEKNNIILEESIKTRNYLLLTSEN